MTDTKASLCEASADRLVEAVQQFTAGTKTTDLLLAALADTTSVLGEVAAEVQLQQVVTDVDLVIDRYTRAREYLDAGMVAVSQQFAWLPLRFTLDAILLTWDGESALQQAEQDLAQIEQIYADARLELEAAMAAGDVDAVMDRRLSVTLTLPEQVDAARVHFLDLRVQRAEIEVLEFDARLSAYLRASDDAEKRFRDLQVRLGQALEAWSQAKNLHQEATPVRNQHAADADELRRQLENLTASTSADHQQRLRQLAGV